MTSDMIILRPLRQIQTGPNLTAVNEVIADLEKKAVDEMVEGYPEGEVILKRFADAKYPAQIHELTVDVPSDKVLDESDIKVLENSFHDLHEQMFTYSVRESSVDIFHWRVVAYRSVKNLTLRSWI